MKTKPSFIEVLLSLAALSAAVLPFASWLLNLMGLPVRSMFSDEGLRWLFLHGAESMCSYGAMVGIGFFASLGSLMFVGFDGSLYRRTPFLISLFFAALIDALLLCDVPSFVSFLCAGMLRYAPWMACVALCSFLYSGLRFVLL